MSKGYNGWTNYETWCVNLWMDNEEGSYDYWREVAEDVWDAEDPDRSQRLLADRIRQQIEEGQPLTKGLYADLIEAALSEVDWDEIASHFIYDLKAEAKKEDVETE
jgi:hypothetical protein